MQSNQNLEKNANDPARIAFLSTLLNVLVAGAKGILAWLSDSSALLADTIHGFSDRFASLLVLVRIWLSKRKSKAFPWGLYKVENLVALMSGALIFFAGYEIVHHIFKGEKTFILGHFYSSLLCLLAIILAVGIFSRFEAKKAKALNSPSLLADYARKTFDGKGPSYVFSNADVEVTITEDETIGQIRRKLTGPETH